MSTVIDAIIRLKDQFTPVLRHVNERINETHKATERAGKSISKFGKSVKGIGESLTPIAASCTALGVGAVKAFGDFEEAANKVQVKLDSSEWGRMDELNQQAINLSKSYQQSVGSIQAVQEQLASAGFDATQVLEGTQAVLNGIDATGADATVVASLAANSLNAFGLQASDLTHVMDMLVVTANQTNTGIEEMAESYKYCSSAASALKVDMADVSTAIGLMSNGGLKGSEAGTAVKDMLERMTNPEFRSGLEAIGVQVQTNNGQFIGMGKLLDQMREKMAGMTDMEKMDIIKGAFGSTALPGVVTLLNQTSEEWERLNNQIRNSDGVSEDAAKVLNSGLNAQMKILKNNIVACGIQFGGQLKGSLTGAIDLFSGLAKWIQQLTPEQAQLIFKIGGIVIALTALTLIGGSAIIFLGQLITTVSAVTAAIAAAGGVLPFLANGLKLVGVAFRGVGLAMKSLFLNPVGLVIAAVALLAFAAYELYTHWGGVKEFFAGLWDGTKEKVSQLVDYLSNCWNGVKEKISNVWESIKQAVWSKLEQLIGADRLNRIVAKIQNLGNILRQHITTIVTFITSIFNRIRTNVMTGVNYIVAHVTTAFDRTRSIIMSVMKPIINFLTNCWNKVKTKVVSVFTQIYAFLVGIWNSITSYVSGIINAWYSTMVAIFTDWFSTVVNVFEDVIDFLTNVFTGNWSGAWESVKKIFTDVWDGIKNIANDVLGGISNMLDRIIGKSGEAKSAAQDAKSAEDGDGGTNKHNASGTNNWEGGRTWINENGPEIVDLPQGTRIHPHDESLRLEYQRGVADSQRNGLGGNITIAKLADSIVVHDQQDIDDIATALVYKMKSYGINTMVPTV